MKKKKKTHTAWPISEAVNQFDIAEQISIQRVIIQNFHYQIACHKSHDKAKLVSFKQMKPNVQYWIHRIDCNFSLITDIYKKSTFYVSSPTNQLNQFFVYGFLHAYLRIRFALSLSADKRWKGKSD